MTDVIRPCPFCGNSSALAIIDAADVDDRVERGKYFTVVCSILQAGCGATGGFRNSEEEAIEAWNRRADTLAVVDWLKNDNREITPKMLVQCAKIIADNCGNCEYCNDGVSDCPFTCQPYYDEPTLYCALTVNRAPNHAPTDWRLNLCRTE